MSIVVYLLLEKNPCVWENIFSGKSVGNLDYLRNLSW